MVAVSDSGWRQEAASISAVSFLFFTICCMVYPSACDIVPPPCVKSGPCSCKFKNGSSIDLSPLSKPEVLSRFNITYENSTYFFSPCVALHLGNDSRPESCGGGVAVCWKNLNGTFFNMGNSDSAYFDIDLVNSKNVITYNYSAPEHPSSFRQTEVSLVCQPSLKVEDSFLNVTSVTLLKFLRMVLTSPSACVTDASPSDPSSSGLSTGSILLLICLGGILFYLIGGMAYMNLVRGAEGVDMIPHYAFWKEFPLLVRDGCIFCCNGCRTPASYDRL